jgi:CMP-N,N'-diacetyllegionaminic acid synthase
MKVVCHIPVRAGSKRTPNKNLRRIGQLRVVEYVIQAAVESNIFDEIWLNTDSELLIDEHQSSLLKNSEHFRVYRRPQHLCDDNATSDEFNFDFAQFTNADIIVMLNPVCPLLSNETIRSTVDELKTRLDEFDTLITCTSTKMQVFYKEVPLNINVNEALRPSQENSKVTTLNWAVTAWHREKFIDRYTELGYAVLGNNRILHDIDPIEGLKISEESDFNMIASIINGRQ